MGVFLAIIAAALSAPAAAKSGIVARVDASHGGLEGQPTLVLTRPDGTTARLELTDDGKTSDVEAGDMVWSGTSWLDGDAFGVEVEVDGTLHRAGEVSWAADDQGRDLDVRFRDGRFRAEARVAGSEPTPTPPPTVDDGQGGEAAVVTTTEEGPSKPSTPVLLAVAVGLGALVALVIWRVRSTGAKTATQAETLPTAALVAPGLPLPGPGLAAWQVPAAARDALVADLLATLAPGHAVVFAAADDVAAPETAGGPVYRCGPGAAAVARLVHAVQDAGGRSPVVLWVGPYEAAAVDVADALPPHVGGAAVILDPCGALAQVRATPAPGGWQVEHGEARWQLVRTAAGPGGAAGLRLSPT